MKEALFSILGYWIEGKRILDLFGGTGAVGIEGLSRGAAFAHFVDMNRKAVETIRLNLRHCRLEAAAHVERLPTALLCSRTIGANPLI